MSVGVNGRTRFRNAQEVLRNLGGIPASRVRIDPAPGTATIRDLIRLWKAEGLMCELVDGTLVEKPMAIPESHIAGLIQTAINNYLATNKLGFTLGEQGMLRLVKGLVRAPDVSFVSWDQLPQPKLPREAIQSLYPDLAVEVYSKGNTRKEMARKRREYFRAGCRLVWMVYPRTETVDVYTDPEHYTTRTNTDTLDGDAVLPGFRLQVRSIFEDLVPLQPKPRKRR
jgi:Uma2 family endonuclease